VQVVTDQRIRVEVVRSGGFAGQSRTGRVDTADLDEEGAATLRRLLSASTLAAGEGAVAAGGGGPDRFQYSLTIIAGGERRSIVVDESDLSDADQRLLAWVLAEGRTTG